MMNAKMTLGSWKALMIEKPCIRKDLYILPTRHIFKSVKKKPNTFFFLIYHPGLYTNLVSFNNVCCLNRAISRFYILLVSTTSLPITLTRDVLALNRAVNILHVKKTIFERDFNIVFLREKSTSLKGHSFSFHSFYH